MLNCYSYRILFLCRYSHLWLVFFISKISFEIYLQYFNFSNFKSVLTFNQDIRKFAKPLPVHHFWLVSNCGSNK